MASHKKNRKPSAENTRNDKLAEAVKVLSRAVDAGNRREERSRRDARRGAYWTSGIAIVSVILTIVASSYWNAHEERIKRQYAMASEVQEEINRKLDKKDSLNLSMTEVRSTRDIAQRLCNRTSKTEFADRLRASDYRLVNAQYATKGVFGSKINKEILIFLEDADVDKQGVCDDGAVKDYSLRKLQAKINRMMVQSINTDSEKKERLLKEKF